MKIVVLIGKPCAGKSTRLNEFLAENPEKYVVLSIGNMLREAIHQQIQLGLATKHFIDSGQLVPDYIVVDLLLNSLQNIKETNVDSCVILDGVPRNIEQAKSILNVGLKIDKVIYIDIIDEIATLRSGCRVVCNSCGQSYITKKYAYLSNGIFKVPKKDGVCNLCGGMLVRRNDDEEDVVKKRLEVYHKVTEPMYEFLEEAGIECITLDGDDSNIKEIFNAAMKSF
jgi:adenylate kinase